MKVSEAGTMAMPPEVSPSILIRHGISGVSARISFLERQASYLDRGLNMAGRCRRKRRYGPGVYRLPTRIGMKPESVLRDRTARFVAWANLRSLPTRPRS